mgnify:CR=1 FL=1
MKKYYKNPVTTVLNVDLQSLLNGSGVNSDKGIGYGGVDTDGIIVPGARRRHDLWEEELEDVEE